MCVIYSLFALSWLISTLYYWHDLVRIQIWIGGVILLGLMEMTAYLVKYKQIDKIGFPTSMSVVLAEVISCMNYSLARMLVMMISLGYGIVK